ncbi:MAG TPA: cbb3-type cytochrome c oxidase subunit I [Candidatus Acidoferrum sp.]|nr:cbb3-type cytochrome c oxidase subunit I [Candidatus Acidoferrum sp.]
MLSSISALSHAPAESGARLLFDESQSTNPSSPALRFQHQTSRRIVSLGMVTNHSGGPAPEAAPAGFLARTIFNSGHKTIGLRYLWLALGSVLLGMLLSLLMRIHLVWPAAQIPFFSGLANAPERYAALTMLHGSLMVFLVLTTAPQAGFGNYFLPLQIGAREVAFPSLNLFSFWATVISVIGITASFLVQPDAGLTLWTASVALFCFAALLTSINFTVTTLDLRAKGMTLPRMPLTVWAWFINAILSMLIFSILLAACVFLLSDRLLASQFFSPLNFLSHQPASIAQSTLFSLWQRLFWFFAQAEVYVAMLPCFGIVSHLLSTFSRKPVWAERAAVLALCGVGLFGFCVWGQHMFSSGLNPWSPLVFSLLASSLGLPACVLLFTWLGTLWNAKIQFTAAMLFALGFVSLFLTGGISGIFLAGNSLAAISVSVSDDFVTGHFHLVMGVAATFAILGALFFWFPKMFGRSLNETLGKFHFWLTFAGVYCVFMPMHWLGLMARSQTASGDLAAVSSLGASFRTFITVATLVTVAAQALFLFNFIWSLARGEKSADCNPWRSTTLEWSVPSPPPFGNFGATEPIVYRGAYEFSASGAAPDFISQNAAPTRSEAASEPKQAAKTGSTEK